MNEQTELMKRMLTTSDVPSEDYSRYWHSKASPSCTAFTSNHTTGKWCIFPPPADVDAAWDKIKGAVERDELLCAKTSTALGSMGRDTHVICVYTQDWSNLQDLMRVRSVLRALGFTAELGYKRDRDTLDGVYGPDEWYLRD